MKSRCHKANQVSEEIRKTTEGRRYFKPEHAEVHKYCIGRASRLHQQELCAAAIHPDGVHEIVLDLAGSRSMFNRTFHSLMTHFTRALADEWIDHVWANDRPEEHRVVGEDPEKIPPFHESIEACVDVWLACVKDGTCDHPNHFEGFMIRAGDWGKPLTAARPEVASPRTSLPETVTFTPMPPPCEYDLTLQEKIYYAELVLAMKLPAAREEGRAAREQPAEQQRKRKREKPRGGSYFRGDAEGVKLAEAEYEAWLKFYDECRLLFKEDQTVVFPAGTVRFRMLGANCDPLNITRCL